jgi:hypothetical protein
MNAKAFVIATKETKNLGKTIACALFSIFEFSNKASKLLY